MSLKLAICGFNFIILVAAGLYIGSITTGLVFGSVTIITELGTEPFLRVLRND